MELVERITSNPFIFAFFMLVALVLGGVLIGAFILVFGMGTPGILAGLTSLYIMRQQIKAKIKQGEKITMFYKTAQAGLIALIFLLALISLTPWFTR